MRTVFVVGAGASVEFRGSGSMPIGSELAIQIESLIDEDFHGQRSGGSGPVSRSLMQHSGMGPEHISAMMRIRQSIQSKNSVDDFINEWSDIPELPRIAKLCIAECILRAESSSLLSNLTGEGLGDAAVLRGLRDTWLGQLVRSINPAVPRRNVRDSFKDVAFITFNYDRCIEHFLYHHFTSTLGLPQADAVNELRNIPIHHVYGSLGDIEPLSRNGAGFGAQRYAGYASQGIRTYCEKIGSDEQQAIYNEILKADRIIILGCAYHAQNLDLLFGRPPRLGASIWGTAFNLPSRRVRFLEEYFGQAGASLQLSSSGCAAMLSQWDEQIFEYDPI
ncbi:hypothetical protein F4693_002610 [Sphingomonas endophytica]|uniref:SIR2-like domain-containing protein n=1 Tax=Sphingomonas endophytica TaxID=869719 RepID=A0A7X0JDG0_9SPHN|nr:hypothetical protein [Sphingomonas endophytica]MBB6505618.1 hypothetical protein [Sphingomonas endophytica]